MITRTELLEKYKNNPLESITLESNENTYRVGDYINYLRLSLHKVLFDWINKNIIYDDAKDYLLINLDTNYPEELILLIYNIMTTTYYNDTPGMHFEILDYDKFIKDE